MAIYKEVVRVRITDVQLEALKKISEEEEMTVSEIIREAIEDKFSL